MNIKDAEVKCPACEHIQSREIIYKIQEQVLHLEYIQVWDVINGRPWVDDIECESCKAKLIVWSNLRMHSMVKLRE